jgi:C4-dicarboxylate-specific signal transduction histidine kinase
MATKKIALPEGIAFLPFPALLYSTLSSEGWANSAFEQRFGPYSGARFKKRARIALIHERPVDETLFSQPGRHEGFVLESPAGEKHPVEIRVSAWSSDPKGMNLVIFEDIREKQELEKQLIQNHLELKNAFEELKRTQAALTQSAKLASLGELASGIAHELNQPLQAIMGFSQEISEFETLSSSGKEFIGDIINASRKMAEIIKSLRSFAREAGEDQVETSVEHAVREAARLMGHSLMQKGIELEIQADPALPLILANPIQLEQVFVNLISNARDAIEQAHAGRGKITVQITRSGPYPVARVIDDGCGMTDEVRQKVFDPFFTTKEVGKGTGLGLSISYGILKKLGAQVDVKSQVGTGTRFEIVFRPLGINQEGEAA